ncbi:MAG: hypothetical protein GJT30_14100 [Geobacter sp.]|nr:hypothetical protein [Geobacter sp.]
MRCAMWTVREQSGRIKHGAFSPPSGLKWLILAIFMVMAAVAPVLAESSIDVTPPVTTATPAGGTYGNPYVYLSCSDGTGSGCAATYYCLGAGCTPVTAFSYSIHITSSTDLRFYSIDQSGNSEPVNTASYTIDATPPETTATVGSGIYSSTQSVSLVCSDGTGSGCSVTSYCLGKGCYPSTRYTGPISISSSTYLNYYSLDVALNRESTKTERYTILTAPPVGIYVPADQATIQAAIDGANDGDTVLVAPGTYVENIDFKGKAITVASTGGAEVTIIDGNKAGAVAAFITGEAQTTILDGFTLRNGYVGQTYPTYGRGGGIYMSSASPTISNNRITANTASDGGGIYVTNGAPLIRNNVITSNNSGYGGGGISLYGAAGAQLIDNTISGNNASNGSGGGIYSNGSGKFVIRGNRILDNTTTYNGGGIAMVNTSSPEIIQNLITGNSAGSGGGIHWSTPTSAPGIVLVNNTIAANDAALGGGIFAGGYDANALLMNNIVLAKPGQAALYCDSAYDNLSPQLKNNLIFTPDGSAYSGICTDQNSINGNITADPQLSNAALGYYGLRPGSPAIDAGDNLAPSLPTTDLGGLPRLVDGTGTGTALVDMGAYEFDPAYPIASLQGIPTDFLATDSLTLTVGGTGVVSYRYALDGGAFTGTDATVATPITLTGLANGLHSIVVLGKNAQGLEQLLPSATAVTWLVNTETTDLVFTSGGTAPWFIQAAVSRDGIAYQSGAVASNQSSWLETTVTGPGAIRFWWQVSSQSYYSPLTFSIDGTAQASISGEVAWQQKAYDIPAGSHTLRWEYAVSAFLYTGANAAWLDQIGFEAGTSIDITPPVTTATPAGGPYNASQSVTLTTNEPATIYYTTDGTTPTTASSQYGTPITISTPTTLKFFAVDGAGNIEAVKSAAYTFDTTPPTTTASYGTGVYGPITPYLYCNDVSGCAATYYCLGSGCTPTTVFSGFVPIYSSTDLRFYSVDRAGNSEPVNTVSYTIDPDPPVTTPSVVDGIYAAPQSVALACSDGTGTGCSTTYYCLGQTCSPNTPYAGPIDVSSSAYLRYYSRDTVLNQEHLKTERYTILTALPVTINVPADQSTIQAAIDGANDGDTVLVAPGTYVENIDFKGKAITVSSSGGAEVTIIDGNLAGPVITFSTGESLTSILDGFTIRNGKAWSSAPAYGNGGGIYISSASPTIRNNRITGNSASEGAGIYLFSGSPLIQHNHISRNHSLLYGGGLGMELAVGARILDNVITDNSSDYAGGGISIYYGNDATLSGNVVTHNTALQSGGGVWTIGSPWLRLVQNLIADNVAKNGSALFCIDTHNTLLAGNTLFDDNSDQGSVVYIDTDIPLGLFANNIVMAAGSRTAVSCSLSDSAVLEFSHNAVYSASGAAYGDTCTDQNGVNGNITADPLLIAPAFGYYGLRSGSPAIDAGDNGVSSLPATDLDGLPRIVDGTGQGVASLDIGAYEFDPAGVRATLSGVPVGATQETWATISVGGTDIVSYRYALDGGDFTTIDTPVATPISLTGLGGGTHAIAVIGKTSSREQQISSATVAEWTVDTIAPVTTASPAGGSFSVPQTVTLACRDGSGSGCAGTFWCLGGGCSPTTPYTAPIAVNATAGLRFYSVDTFGNREEVRLASFTLVGTISGRVIDSGTGAGIPNLYATAYNAATGVTAAYALTDSTGAYRIAGLPSGSYKLYFSLSGYVGQWYDGQTDRSAAATVAVTAPNDTAGINVAMARGGVITGTVTDAATGTSVGNVYVTIFSALSGQYIGSGYTDGTGAYSIGGLVPGSYKLSFQHYGNDGYLGQWYSNASDQATATIVNVAAAATTSGINAALRKGGSISGTVTDSGTGAGIPSAGIIVYDAATGSWIKSVSTDSTGAYSVNGLSGSYKIRFTAAGYIDQWFNGKSDLNTADSVTVTAPNQTSGINALLVKGGSINGLVTDSATGAIIAGASAEALDATSGSWIGYAMTDSTGHYGITGLPSGSYKIRIRKSEYVEQWYGGESQSSAASIAVTTANATSGIDVRLIKGGIISGTVTDRVTGVAISAVYVTAEDAATGTWKGSGNTDSSGNYSIKGLSTGNYNIRFQAQSGSGYATQWYNDQIGSSSANTVAVTAPATVTGIDATLAMGGTIQGVVIDRDTGMAVQNVYVYAYHALSDTLIASTGTDSAGSYRFIGLATGSYKVRFSAAGYAVQWYGNATVQEDAASVTVTAPETIAGINAALVRGGKVTGRITDRITGAGIANVYLYLVDRHTGNWAASGTTDQTGAYVISGLVPSSYRLRIEPSSASGYFASWYKDQELPACAETITVTDSSTIAGIDAQLDPGGSISGRVTDAATGAGISNTVIGFANITTSPVSVSTGGIVVDGTGAYTIGGLRSGSYRLTFSAPGYVPVTSATVSVTAPGAVAGTDAALTRGGGISGKVTDSITGAGIYGVSVMAVSSVPGWSGHGISDPSGNYTITGLPSGDYYLYYDGRDSMGNGYGYGWYQASTSSKTVASDFSSIEINVGIAYPDDTVIPIASSDVIIFPLPETVSQPISVSLPTTFVSSVSFVPAGTPVTVTAPGTITGINMGLNRMGGISGRLTDSRDGTSLDWISVSVYDATTGVRAGSTISNLDGSYSVGGLPSGIYRVQFRSLSGNRFYPASWYGSSASFPAEVRVTAPDTTAGIDASLVAGGIIAGSISTTVCPGPDLVRVKAYDAVSGVLAGDALVGMNYSDRFTLAALPAGSYKIAVSVMEDGFIGQWYDNSNDSTTAEPVTVATGIVTDGINLIIAVGNGSIAGRVADSSGAAVVNLPIKLFDWYSGGLVAETSTLYAAGSYRLAGIANGTYKLLFGAFGGYPDRWYRTASESAEASPIVVSGGVPVTGIDLTTTGEPDCDLDGSGGLPDLVDAIKALRIAAGLQAVTPENLAHGDVSPLINGKSAPDGRIDIGDTVLILRRVIGIPW